MKRVAVIYNDQSRPETTGLCCRRALGELVQRGKLAACEHLLPSELERVSPGAFDLFLYVDDGLQRSIREELRPAIWWGIDSHLEFERCLHMASLCDLPFTAQRDGAERLQAEGIKTATWLPLACDPAIHGRVDVPQQYDIAFVGHNFRNILEQPVKRYFSSMDAGYKARHISAVVYEDMNLPDEAAESGEAFCGSVPYSATQESCNAFPLIDPQNELTYGKA